MYLPLQDHTSLVPGSAPPNGTLTKVDPQPQSPDLLSDILGPLAIEGPPGSAAQSEQNVASPSAADAAAIVPIEEQTSTVQVCNFHCLSSTCNF